MNFNKTIEILGKKRLIFLVKPCIIRGICIYKKEDVLVSVLFTQVKLLGDHETAGLSDGFVAVVGGIISYIGEIRPEGSFDREISCVGKMLLPGLVNAHTHLPMSLLRGIGGGNTLQDWLHNHIFPAEARLDRKSVEIGTRLSVAESLAYGVTCVADMYDYVDVMAEVLLETGINGNLSRGVVCFDDKADLSQLPGFLETKALFSQYHRENQGQILCNLSIHAEYTSFPKVWEEMARLSQEYQAKPHIHISETKVEHENCKKKYGKTPLALFEDYGLWEYGGLAAHCVWTEESDWVLMAKKGISPVHNPVSNLKLGSGVAPVEKMLEKNVNVCLGTDGVASNNNHDLWEEIKLTALLHKGISGNPKAISSKMALDMATKQGGIALGRKTGVVAEGYDADLILVDTTGVSMIPCHDMTENLVFSSSGRDVSMTMCRGRILYENGVYTTIDMEKLRKDLTEYAVPRILGQLSS